MLAASKVGVYTTCIGFELFEKEFEVVESWFSPDDGKFRFLKVGVLVVDVL